MTTRSGRSYRNRLSDSQFEELIVHMIEQMEPLSVWLSSVQASQTANTPINNEQDKASQANNKQNQEGYPTNTTVPASPLTVQQQS